MLCLLALWGGAATAEEVVFDPAVLIECLDQGAQHVCIGAGAEECVRRHLPSTPVNQACGREEYLYWQRLLDRAYARRLAHGQSVDDMTEFADPQPPRRAEALEAAHAAWQEFRALQCAHVEAEWWGGTGRGSAYFRCLMELTAGYALFLQPDIWQE
ncbi:MAG: DUF1311 domain-containing protein [Rhodobacteraceae bacterium]|nr:MAG: DUF1311 domain-containing protein [Paracoccaceae bacterium]